MAEQNHANHVRWVPAYHWFVLPVLTLNFFWSISRLVKAGFSLDGLMGLLTAAALVLLAFYARVFALSVQDRVIRLEERLRFEKLFPNDLKPRISEFTRGQLVALRFASDVELPGLAHKVLNDNVADAKTIKKMVQNWRADYLRA
jgi:hypothetical protein